MKPAFALGVILFGCGGQVSAPDAGVCGMLPQLTPAQPNGAGTTAVFAANAVFVGDADWDGTPDANAWMSLGFDLDRITGPSCRTFSNAVVQEGACGIDNSFAQLLAGFGGSSALQTSWATTGRWTWLIRIDGFVPTGTASVTVQVFVGAPLSSPPLFDGTDTWNTAQGLDSQATAGTIVDGVVTTGPFQTSFDGALSTSPNGPYRIHATLHVVAMQLQISTDGERVDRGILAGTVSPQAISDLPCDLVNSPNALYFTYNEHYDIHSNLSADPASACDAFSFGIGFSAARA